MCPISKTYCNVFDLIVSEDCCEGLLEEPFMSEEFRLRGAWIIIKLIVFLNTLQGYEVYPQVKEDTDKLCKQVIDSQSHSLCQKKSR